MSYKPKKQFVTPFKVFEPTYENKKGVNVKSYPEESDIIVRGSFATYVGMEKNSNDLHVVQETAMMECYFDPRIKSDCRVQILQTGHFYEIVGEPENIELRNQFLKFKVRAVRGGA